MVFMIISGFVIAHLIIERQETYGRYIFRRFMRIFPLFAVCCAAGYLAMPLLLEAVDRVPYRDAADFHVPAEVVATVGSQVHYLWQNALAHLSMLHGLFPDEVLPDSQYVFDSPGWSLSLEWQFYLVAPLAMLAVRRPPAAVLTLLALLVPQIAYEFGLFGTFHQRSLLFAATPFFAVGIASRLAYPHLAGSLRYPAATIAVLLALVPLGWQLAPFAVWGCVYAAAIADRRGLTGIGRHAVDLLARALENRFALAMGRRSYSIYLCHMPLLALCLYALTASGLARSSTAVCALLLATLLPATCLASWILYALVERPGIRLGNRVAARAAAATREAPALSRAG